MLPCDVIPGPRGRQGNRENRPSARAAFRPHPAAVGIHDPLDDTQSEARSRRTVGAGRAPVEPVEDALAVVPA